MKRTNLLRALLISGFFAALTFFSSCEVGLGSAVDTQAPQITIEKPEVDMVIRQKFVISGTWQDDGTIDKVYVKLSRTDKRPLDGKSTKELLVQGDFAVSPVTKEEGTWEVNIDPLNQDLQIIDGTYQATIVIKDKGSHTSTQSTTFTIDNTPPVLILTKPNSTPGDKTISAYGQRLFLEGNVADSTKDTWIEINFYSDPSCSQDSYLTTLETGLIAPTDVNSNNARLAAFSEDLTQDLATEYNRIYGHLSKEGKETIYSTITVYDTAETCTKEDLDQPVGINGNIKGNASQTFYLSKLLAESITKSKQAGGYGLAPIDIYNVLNNSYELKNEARSADAIKIRAELEKETLKKTKAIFELNPENSPYFTVSGLKTIVAQDFKKGDGYTIVNGTQTLEISVFMGSDSIALKDDDNFYVYLLKCNDDGTIPKGYDTEEHRIKLYSKAREEGNGAAKKIYYEIGGKTDHKTTSGAYVFTIPMSQKIWADPDKEGTLGYADVNLEFGQKYRIFVSGSDTENNPVETTDPSGYGFLFTAGGTAPIVDITEPKDTTVWLKKGDTLPVKGTVKSEEGTPRFMVLNNGEVIKEFTLTPSGTGGLYVFDDEIPASAFDQTESLVYSLEFLATRDETKSPYPKSVWYDVIGPEITMGAPSPLIKADSREGVSKDSVNGQIRFSGSITDQFDRFQSASYKVEQGGAVVSGPSLSGDLESNFNFTLDTSLLADKTDATIIITAYDRAGNQTQASYTYYVDQETDKPMITSTEAGKDITKGTDAAGLAFVKSGNNLFVRGGNLVLSVNDDDGVASARVTVQAYNEASNTYEAIEDLDEKQNLVYNSPSAISHTLPSSVGIYRVTVKVFDNNCNVTNPEETINNYKDIQFFLRVTGTGPDVSITPDRDYIRTGGKYELTINVTDEGNKPYKLKKMVAGSTEEETLLENITDDEITYELTPASTANIKFTIIDKNSSFTEKNFTPRFDDGAPSIEIKNYPDTPLLTEEESYLFKGEMHDVGNSGIDKVQIKFANGEQTSTDDTGWTDCSAGLANWNSEITWSANPVFNTEGSKTVFVKAIDGAGNEAIDYKTFTYDKSKPVLTIPAYLSTSATNVIFQEVDAANGYTLSGTVTETNGLAENEAIQIKVDDVLVKTMTAAAVTGTNWSYTIPIGSAAGNLKANQAVKIQVIAKDKAGKTDTKQFSVYYDTKSPTLEVSAPASDEPVADPQKAIKGTVSDEEGYGIEKVEFELRKRGTTTVVTSLEGGVNKPVKSEYYRIIVKGEQWFYAGPDGNSVNPVAIPLGADEGALDLYVKATENKNAAGTSGGRITEKTIPFYYDKANPGLEENEVGTTGKTTNGGQGLEITLKGKVWDSNELESLTIKCGNKTWVSGIDSNITITGSTKLESAPAADNWTATFKVGSGNSSVTNYIADGTNEFTIIAKDIAGKEKQLNRTVVVDTTKPTVGTITVDTTGGTTIGEGNDAEIWYKTTSVPVTVEVSDSGTGSAFSAGISKVEYQAGSGSYAPLSKVGDNYSGTVNFSGNGTQTLNLKVTDVAGNESTVKPTTVHIDTTAPSLSALYYKKGTASAEAVDASVSSIYVKSNTQLTVYGNYEDAESGVNALAFAYGSPTVTYSETAIGDSAPADSNYSIEANAITGKETSIKSWKAVFTPSASGAFIVSGSNRTTNTTGTLKVFDVTVDGEAPVVDNVKLIEVKDDDEKQAYSDGSKYFVNNTTTGKTFKISGVATDNVGVDSVELLITKDGSTTTKTAERKGSLGQWHFEGIDLSDWTGTGENSVTGATAKVTVKDKAGNTTEKSLIIKFDITAPATDHKIDDSQKNLEFRIGDAANDAGQEDVGGKYSNGSYGSALTMQLRGNFPDNEGGSGINKFYYRTFNNQEVKIASPENGTDPVVNGTDPVVGTGENEGKIFFKDDAALIAYVVANKTDVFTPLAAVETKNVEYNIGPFLDDDNKPLTSVADTVLTNARILFGGDPTTAKENGNYTVNSKGYVQFRTSVDTNFKTTMKGFVEGKNYLVIVAEDNAGNLGLDTATVGGVEYPCYSLNVDITAPAIPTKQEEPVFTNLKETNGVVISGTVSDKPNVANGSSGLSKIIITRDGGTGSVEVTNFTAPSAAERTAAGTAYTSDTTLKHWEADVSSLLPSSGMAIISAKVVDNAGFSTSLPVANITVDRKGPAVTINSPAADSAKGSTLTISGTANDGNGAGLSTKATDKIILYATTKASTAGIVTYDPTDNTIITGITIGSASDASTKWVKLAEVATSDEWKFEDLDVSSITSNETNTPVYFTVAVKDASGTGNTGYAAPRRIVIDRKKPTFVSGTVGGKTDTNAWFNTRTLNIAGSFTDPATVTGQNAVNGSGVNYVYYLIGNNEDDKVALPTTDSTYNTNITITGDSSTASLSIWASDAAGNESKRQTYTLQIDADVPEVVENVTAQQPAGYFNNSTLTDGRSQKTFTFLVQDKAGGSTVKTSDASALEVKVGRYSLTTTGTEASSLSISKQENSDGKENYLVTLEIGKTDLARLNGNSSILVTASDVAGNKSPATSIGSLNVDKTAPTVTIKDPDDKGTADKIQINGTFTLEGNARDNNALQVDTGSDKSLKLYYTTKDQTTGITTYANSSPVPTSITTGTDAATAWKSLDSAANAADWSFSINTSTISTGKKTVHFLVETKDEAGNTGYSNPKTLEIDQDTDRPVITFSNLELGPTMSSSTANNYEGYVWLKNTTKIIGTVSDDDGVQSMKISLDGSDWKDVTLTGSAFSYDLKNFYTTESTDVKKEAAANGPKVLYFKVTDKASSPDTCEFTSKTTSSISAVKISDGTNEYGNSTKPDSLLYVKVDTLYPQVILKGAKLASDQSFTNAYNTIRLGGDKKSFVVKLAASDAMGINEVSGTADFVYTVKNGNQEIQSTLSKPGTISDPVTEEGETVYTATFTLSDTDVTTLSGNAGAVNIRVVAKDNAGNETPQTASIAYDFAPSLVTSWNPSSSVTNSGNVTAYGILTENAKVWYSISPSRTVGPNGSVTSWTDGEGTATTMTATVQDWQELPGNSNTWTVNFDNGSSDASHEKSLNMYLIDYGIAPRKSGALATSDDIESTFNKFVKLYLWIKTEDDAGNIKADSVHELLVDPQGDKPSIAFSYPSENSKTLGNEVSIYGTAQDLKGTNIGVDSVWVQIKSTTHGDDTTTNYGTAPSYNESTEVLTMTLTSADLDYMAGNGYKVYKMSDYKVGVDDYIPEHSYAENESYNKRWDQLSTTEKDSETAVDWAALASSSGASWNISINKDAHKELNPPDGTTSNAVGIRVFARDGDKKLSLKADRYVIFDADNPIIKDLYLVQSTDGKLATASTASRQYTPDMFVKGKWYLTGTVTDNMGISELVINGETLIKTESGTASIANGTTIKGTEANPKNWTDCVSIASSGNGETVTFKYPLATDTADSFDNLSFRIVAKDKVTSGNPHEKEEPISINYDNKPPEIARTAEAGKNISADVQQRNSWYNFSSKVTEASQDNKTQSGFAYTAFYFTRNDTVNSKEYLYDVLKARDAAAVNLTGKTIATAFGSEAATENTIVKANDIYWYRKNITRQASLNTFTVSDATGIRKNALVYIDGAMYLITSVTETSVTETSVTIDGYPKNNSDNDVAYVAIAGIVDNTIPEGDGETIQSDGYYNPPSRDDGDRMIESVDKSGTTWTWQAQICSRNIADGPITLHYVVFDKAGNYTPDSVTGTVSNNRPRIAGATFATDYNGDGDTEDDGESFANYSIASSYTNYWTGGTEASPVFDPDKIVKNSNAKNPVPTSQIFGSASGPIAVLRGKTVITPEIVGGNGKIYYSYKINNDNSKKGQNSSQIIDNGSLDYTAKTGNITIQLGDLLSWNDTENASTAWPFEFTFWDSTAGTEAFHTSHPSQSATLTMYFAIQAKTVGTPTVTIKPFYWNSLTDNSIEDSENASKAADLKGHIELEADWETTDAYDGNATTGLFDGDPKVSGKIVITGTAHDDSRINTLKANIFGTEKTVATFTANNKLESSFAKTAFDTNHLWFNITKQTIDETGHNVEWELHIDTEKMLTGMAGTDQSVSVTATNFGVPSVATSNAADALVGVNGSTKWNKTPSYTGAESNTPGTTQTTSEAKTDYYKMDIVPYITEVKRNSAYNTHRSGMGNYPMMREESGNTVTGFNLGKTDSETPANTTAGLFISSASNASTGLDVEALSVSGNTATFTIPATAVDGYLQYYVKSGSEKVLALNNMNNNAAYTKEEGDTRWYDDRYVRIWQSNANDKFAASYPTYPAMAMGSNGDLFMSYTFYSKSVVYINQLMSNTKTQIFTAGDQPEETDIMVNGTNDVNVIYQANHHYGGSQDRWSAQISGAGSINLYNDEAPYWGTYPYGNYWRFEGTWHNQMLQQLKNAKVATSGNNVYHTIWYDKITKAIKYSNVNKSATQNAYVSTNSDNDATTRPGEIGWVVLDGDADLDDIVQTNQRTTNGYNGGENKYQNRTFNHPYLNGVDANTMYSVALGKTPEEREAIMNRDENSLRKTAAINANGNYKRYDYTGANGGTEGYRADCYEDVSPTSTCGEYAAICVTSKGYPVVVYFDVDNKMLKVARGISTNPKGMNTENNNDGAAAWRIQQVALTSGHIGNDASYVSAVIDSARYLHIAFQNSRGELIYTRSTNTTDDISLDDGFEFDDGSVIVDTNGTWASITVDSNNVPQIAYMANTSGYDTLKLAYPLDSGAATWKAAANWETMYAPMNAKSSNVKTCVVARPSGKTGGQVTGLSTYWKTGIGFATSEDYRVMKYIGSGAQNYKNE